MHHNYYVYTHTRLDTNEVFYVGIGKTPQKYLNSAGRSKYTRAYEKSKRSTFWKSISNKTEFDVKIVYETASENEIKLKEQELIAYYGRRCCDNFGTLVNFTSGGDRNDNPRYYGVKVSQKTLKGDLIKIWPELRYIEEQAGFLKTNIVKCCRKKQLTAYGYLWEYTDDRSYDRIRSSTARKKTTNRRVGIDVLDKNGKLLNSFNTQEETANYYKIHRTTLHKYLKNLIKHKYYTFRYRKWEL